MTTHDDLLNKLNQHREQTSEVLFDGQARRDYRCDHLSDVARRNVKTSEVLAINGAKAGAGAEI